MFKQVGAVGTSIACLATVAIGSSKAVPAPISFPPHRSATELSQLVIAARILPKFGLDLLNRDANVKDRSKCVILQPPLGEGRPFCAIADSSPSIRTTDGVAEFNCVAEIEAGQVLPHYRSVRLVIHWVNLETGMEDIVDREFVAASVDNRSLKSSHLAGVSPIASQPHSYTAVVLVRDSDEECWKAISSKRGIVRPPSVTSSQTASK